METIKNIIALAHQKFKEGERGEVNILELIIGIFICAVLAGALLPTGINTVVAGKNISGTWDSGTTATYASLPILLVVCAIAGVAGLAYRAMKG